MKHVLRFASLSLSTLLLLGCGDKGSENKSGSSSGDGDGDAEAPLVSISPNPFCETDPAEATGTRCVATDDCPCGTYCEFGVCTLDCTEAANCEENQVCSRFGTCVDVDEDTLNSLLPDPVENSEAPAEMLAAPRAELLTASTPPAEPEMLSQDDVDAALMPIAAALPPLDPMPDGTVTLQPPSIRIEQGDTQPFTAVFSQPGEFRAAASDIFEVSCDNGETFADECFGAVSEDSLSAHLVTRVIPDAEFTPGQLGELTVLTAHHRASSSLSIPTDVPEPDMTLREGTYIGRLEIQKFGSRGVDVPGLNLSSRVEAHLHPTGIVTWTDPTGLLGATEFVARVVESGGVQSLEVASHRMMQKNGSELRGDVALEFALGPITVNNGFMSAALDGLILGSSAESDAEHAPVVSAVLNLRRTGDLPEDVMVPVFEADVLEQNPLARAGSFTAFENAIGFGLDCGEAAVECAQHLLCRRDGTLVGDGSPPYLFTTTNQDGPSGLLRCETGEAEPTPSLAFPLFDSSEAPLGLYDAVEACADDLEAFINASAAADPVEEGDFDTLFSSAGCVSAQRVLGALGVLQDRAIVSPENYALTNHLWMQWAQINTFLLNGRVELDRAAALDDDSIDPSDTLAEVLDYSLKSMEFALHPRFNRTLVEQPGTSLANTDYRTAFGVTDGTLPELHSAPVFAHFLDTITAQAHLLIRLGRTTCGGSSADAESALLDLTHEYEARAFPLLGTALFLLGRAEEADPEGEWKTAWDNSVVGYIAARNELFEVTEACLEGRNPLGISDLDLPLLFRSPENPSDRFSATSDFLIGTSPESNAWVPGAIDDAQGALEDVRAAWLGSVDRELMIAKSADDQQDRESAVIRDYGERIVAACGDASGLTVENALETKVDPRSCYMASNCRATDAELRERLNYSDIAYNLCLAGKLAEHVGPIQGHASHIAAREFGDAIPYVEGRDDAIEAFDWIEDHLCSAIPFLDRTDLDAQQSDIEACVADEPDPAFDRAIESVAWTTMEEVTSECEALKQDLDKYSRPLSAPETCSATVECPLGQICAGGSCELDLDSRPDPDCYAGSLGEHALAIRTATLNLDTARAEYSELTERYDIAMTSCQIKLTANLEITEITEKHRRNMQRLREAKRGAEKTAGFLGFVSKAFSPPPGFSLIGAAAGLGKVAANGAGKDMGKKMDEARELHREQVRQINAEADIASCFNNARTHLVGATSAALRIEAAMNNASAELLAYENAVSTLRRTVDTGQAELERERAGAVVPLAHDFFIDEERATYERKFRIAQRATYLAVRAVEYEYQACEGLRGAVVEATTPDDLDTIVDSLLTRSSTATLAGKRPSDGIAVVSMRDEILQIASNEDSETQHQLTETERLRLMLTDPRFAVFDESGEYEGQRIPFALAPLKGDSGSVQLLNGSSCAERLWSVNAALVGEDLLVDRDSSFVEVTLEKKNSFFSTLCTDACSAGDGNGNQVASIRPSRNLFADPFYGVTSGVSTSNGEDTEFAAARIRAFRDVSRADLESDDYDNGDTAELAGRGLWGDYALFIRAPDISLDGNAGLALNNIEDILIRFDYVSVAQD